MRIPKDVILIWAGTNDSIPPRWVRETLLDGKFIRGALQGEEPGIEGGSQTHTHTSPSHQHQLAYHTHTYDLASDGANNILGRQAGTLARQDAHLHTGNTNSMTGGTTGATSVTYGPASNDPPYYEVIFIKADYGARLENEIIALYDRQEIPQNWQVCNGQNGSPDLRNRFLKGASAGADAGATGGSNQNVHSINHSHTPGRHSHSGISTSPINQSTRGINSSNNQVASAWHTHPVYLNETEVPIPDYVGSLITTEIVEPLHKKIIAIQRKDNGLKVKNLIGLWLGSRNNIPRGWVICDGNNDTPDLTDYYIKITDNNSEINTIGGSNTHSHGPQSHTHEQSPAHSHTGYSLPGATSNPQTDANPVHVSFPNHTHPVVNVSNVIASYLEANTMADPASNEPEYRTVIFIQFKKEAEGGKFLLNFI